MSASDALLERLSALHPKKIDLSLGRTLRLLAALGQPQDALPPVVHVAGTNGKGSVIAFMRAIMEAAGLKAHVYTSPHLQSFHERIRLAGRLIDEKALAATLDECEAANGGRPITLFEITTAAAFVAFSRHAADVLLLETGLGGRFDATNVIARPALCVLSPISIDHREFLGSHLTAIAAEKAAIIKPGCPLVSAPQAVAVLGVIEAAARTAGAALSLGGRDWKVGPDSAIGPPAPALLYEDDQGRLRLPMPALAGPHQVENAGLAIRAARLLAGRLKVRLPEPALAGAMTRVRWPARLQRLDKGPLVDGLPKGSVLWLDGGHNPAAARAIADAFADKVPDAIVVGMMANKDAAGFLAPLKALGSTFRFIPVAGAEGSMTPQALLAAAADTSVDGAIAGDMTQALESLSRQAAGRPLTVLVCGSLYLAGQVLSANGAVPR